MSKFLTEREWQKSLADAFGVAVKSTYQDLIEKAVAEEREACAKALEDTANKIPGDQREGFVYKAVMQCAGIIRARGSHESV